MDHELRHMYGLIFDLDGVIADTEGLNVAATGRVFKEELGIAHVTLKDFEAGLGRGAEAYVRAGAAAHGVELTDEQVETITRLRQEYFFEELSKRPLPPFPGVMKLVQDGMAAPDFRLAIATSGTEKKSRAVLESAGIPYTQMTYINGNMVSNKKPDPELFLRAIEGIDVAAGRCVVIEDAPDGVAAARAAGARCIGVTNSVDGERLAEADYVCDTLEDVDLDQLRTLVDGKAK